MTAIARGNVKIAIVNAGVNASAVASTDYILGEIKSYAKTGGEFEVESEPVFGGYIDKQKPATQYSLEFEIRPSIEYADRWDALIYGTTNSVYTANSQAGNKAVFIEATVGSTKKAWGFNNCTGMSWDVNHNADDIQQGTFKFKFSPLTSTGISNFMTKNSTAVTALPAWTTLTSA